TGRDPGRHHVAEARLLELGDEAAETRVTPHRSVLGAQQGQDRGHGLGILLHDLRHAARLLHEVFEHSHVSLQSAKGPKKPAASGCYIVRQAKRGAYSSTRSTARKASGGLTTVPTRFIRFLPSFCC